MMDEELSFYLCFPVSISFSPGVNDTFCNLLHEIITDVLTSKAQSPQKDLLHLNCQATLYEINVKGKIQTSQNQPMTELQKFAEDLRVDKVRAVFVGHAGMQKLLGSFFQDGLLEGQLQSTAGVVNKMLGIFRGLPFARQMFMMSSKQLSEGLTFALQKTQQELTKDLIEMQNLEQDAETYQQNLTALEQKIVIAEKKLIKAEEQLNDTIKTSEKQIENMRAENLEQKQKEEVLHEKIKQLRREFDNLAELRKSLQKMADEKQVVIQDMEKQLKKSMAKHDKSSKDFEATKDDLNQLQHQNNILQKQQHQFQQILINITHTSKIVASKLNSSDKLSISQMLKSLKDLDRNNQELNKKINDNTQQFKIKQELLAWQENEQVKLNQIVSEQKEELEQLSNEYKSLQQNLSDTDELAGNSEDTIRDLQSQVAELKVNLQQSLQDAENNIFEWKQQRSICQSYRELFDMMKFFTGQFTQKHNSILKQEETQPSISPPKTKTTQSLQNNSTV
eukprot:TRINITY_DN637_c0_g2_i7.p1 TRINITY_DN637_c0_g2~~TRINITY_DN637_c0_g2_i7.p1  ORF type:complete len:507 (-),score=91.61 TRINITY_DN637_c0_g2_i7:781-2301(-)